MPNSLSGRYLCSVLPGYLLPDITFESTRFQTQPRPPDKHNIEATAKASRSLEEGQSETLSSLLCHALEGVAQLWQQEALPSAKGDSLTYAPEMTI